MSRSDLLALDEKALVLLANRGLYRRARKQLDKGERPVLEVQKDGTLVGRFGDVETTFPPGVSFKQATCSCNALSACRHRVALILAYQDESAEKEQTKRPKLQLSEKTLQQRLGKFEYRAAIRERQNGFHATVKFHSAPQVLLPTCTVTFLVPWHLEHARCDCDKGVDCRHVAMAMWAIETVEDDGGKHQITVGEAKPILRGANTLAACVGFSEEVLENGWAEGLKGFEARIARLRAQVQGERFVWLEDLLEETFGAIREYQDGFQGRQERCSELLNEMLMRCQAQPSQQLTQGLLHGDGSHAATKLEHVVLRGMGARYRVLDGQGRLTIYFSEEGLEEPLVLERRWSQVPGQSPPQGSAIGTRRSVGTTLKILAQGNITTRGARRRPNRVVEIPNNRLETSVVPGGGSQQNMQSDFEKLRLKLAQQYPDELSPRVRAKNVVCIPFGKVLESGYDPGLRTVWGRLADDQGAEAWVASEWLPEAPGGPGILAEALIHGANFLTAEARIVKGHLFLEPLLIGFTDKSLTLDLAADVPIPDLQVNSLPMSQDPLMAVLESFRFWLGSLGRVGLNYLSGRDLEYGAFQIRQLQQAGLVRLAEKLHILLESSDHKVKHWHEAMTQVVVMSHLQARERTKERGMGRRRQS